MEGINLVGTEVVRNRKGKLRLQMMKLKMPRLIFLDAASTGSIRVRYSILP